MEALFIILRVGLSWNSTWNFYHLERPLGILTTWNFPLGTSSHLERPLGISTTWNFPLGILNQLERPLGISPSWNFLLGISNQLEFCDTSNGSSRCGEFKFRMEIRKNWSEVVQNGQKSINGRKYQSPLSG